MGTLQPDSCQRDIPQICRALMGPGSAPDAPCASLSPRGGSGTAPVWAAPSQGHRDEVQGQQSPPAQRPPRQSCGQ